MTLNVASNLIKCRHKPMKGVVTLKDKVLRIRVDSDFLSKLEYLKQINGFKTIAETVRKLIEKEYRKETES